MDSTPTAADFSATPTLRSQHAALEPLSAAHAADLRSAVGDLHRLWYATVPSPDGMEAEIARRLAAREAQSLAPWAIVDPRSGRAVGMTTYLNLAPEHRRLEIGSTWLSAECQGTGINAAAKLLLLSRAFEDLGCLRVELRTHWHNRQSRTAIERLGAKQDGVLRRHTVLPDGSVRDTVVFSILDHEFDDVRRGLEERLANRD